jgi:hypothetical protein
MTRPDGRVRETATPVRGAVFGLVRVKVSWVVPPTAIVLGKVVVVTVMVGEAGARMVVPLSSAVASAVAPPPDRVTLGVWGEVALASTETVRVIGLPFDPALIAVVEVQPDDGQLQPVPVASENVRPVGNDQVSVSVPDVLATVALGVMS